MVHRSKGEARAHIPSSGKAVRSHRVTFRYPSLTSRSWRTVDDDLSFEGYYLIVDTIPPQAKAVNANRRTNLRSGRTTSPLGPQPHLALMERYDADY